MRNILKMFDIKSQPPLKTTYYVHLTMRIVQSEDIRTHMNAGLLAIICLSESSGFGVMNGCQLFKGEE